jgi:very-short-patch-repair endonuclease
MFIRCNDSRVVVEIDGAQHLTDASAYRRDRRKDQLLQENGSLVLRFLAEDLGRELETVLDTILPSLTGKRQFTASRRVERRLPMISQR